MRLPFKFMLIALAPLASGCVVAESNVESRGVVVSGLPPAPLNEQKPPAPTPRSAWVAGYWHWTGFQYVWIPGHWDTPPEGTVWANPSYTSRGGHYFYEAGGWRKGAARGVQPKANESK